MLASEHSGKCILGIDLPVRQNLESAPTQNHSAFCADEHEGTRLPLSAACRCFPNLHDDRKPVVFDDCVLSVRGLTVIAKKPATSVTGNSPGCADVKYPMDDIERMMAVFIRRRLLNVSRSDAGFSDLGGLVMIVCSCRGDAVIQDCGDAP